MSNFTLQPQVRNYRMSRKFSIGFFFASGIREVS